MRLCPLYSVPRFEYKKLMPMYLNLLETWQYASKELGLEIVAPFSLSLPSGVQINALFLLMKFGAQNGMLIFESSDELGQNDDGIINAEYGFSVMHDADECDEYIKEDIIEILQDWGWTGQPNQKPIWL